MPTHIKTWTTTMFITLGVAAFLGSPPAHADGKNEIRSVSFEEDSPGTTRIHVRGAQTPTFTVYKLERPSRVVVDVPQARLADALRGHDTAAVFTPGTWAVSTIAAQQLDDGGQVVRVIITLARPGRYDVKTDGNEVLVMVTARDAAPKLASPEALAKVQAENDQVKKQVATAEQGRAHAEQDLQRAKDAAAQAQGEAERLRRAAGEQAARATAAQKAADDANLTTQKNATTSAADLARAKQLAVQAQTEAARAKQDATKARDAALLAQTEADHRREASERAQRDAQQETQRARAETAQAKQDVARTKAEADVAKQAAARTAVEIEAARSEAQAAKADAAKARTEADAAKAAAAVDKRKAETAREDAEKLMRDAKAQVAALDRKTADAQSLQDKARATAAAAQAREDAARAEAAKVAKERLAAEDAMKRAAAARDTSTTQAKSEREKLAAEARAAEERLATAKRATEDAERRRATAETAATTAKRDLEQTRATLATIEHQRTAAETAATDAARKRSEAEAATVAASQKRAEAERAATGAAQRRGEAEQQRVAAEQAAREARIAKDAADKQRTVAEQSARSAERARARSEASLAEVEQRRQAAERAASELEQRSKAEATAQAEEVAAKARKAGEAEVAKLRAQVAQLTTERHTAETDLAARRKALLAQETEAATLKAAAAQARETAQREETRRAQLQAKPVVVAAVPVTTKPVAVVPVTKPAPVKANASIRTITFKGDDVSGQVDIAVAGDTSITIGEVTATHAELILDSAELAAKLERKLDVSRFGSPVRAVSSFHDRRTPNRVRLVAELTTPVTPTVDRDNGAVHWKFVAQDTTAAAKQRRPMHAQNVPSPVVGGFGAASTPVAQQTVSQVPTQQGRRRIYHGATVSYDFKDASIHDLLRLIADTGHVNIVVPDTIDAKVTVRLNRVPWDQALEVILASHGLWYRRDGNLYRVSTRKEIDAEDEAEAARRAAAVANENPAPQVVPLNYASAAELKTKLEGMLSQKGTLQVDDRTNALIINDVAGNREQIMRLALSLDTQTPQISIEARIVEARSTFLRQLGIQWGGRATASASGGNATGLVWPSSIGLLGANEDSQTNRSGVATPSDFAVNLPASTGSGEGGAIGLSLGSVGGNFNINLRLSALEDSGTVRIISAPKITVLNNKEAKISQGVSIPISVVSAAGTQTQFVQADLSLTVTPYVSMRDCAIAMNLNVTKNEPDFVNVGARGDPTILRKEARTYMLVQDGETSVLGGIYTRNTGLAYKKVPFFGDLPVLGWLFKTRRENDDRTEILVFITPRITNKGLLHCQ